LLDFATAHADVIQATHRGFAFLVVNGLGWLVAGILALRWPVQRTATFLMLMGFVTVPLALALRALLGFPPYNPDNPLNTLGLLIAFTPAVAVPAMVIAYVKYPLYLPSVMAALVGGHFLPYTWLYQTGVYLALGIAVAVVPSALMLAFRDRGFALGPLFVGAALISGAFVVY